MAMAKNYTKRKLNSSFLLAGLAIVVFITFLLMRFINLDKDLPSFGISLYQANDEGSYSTMALKLQNYGSLTETNTENISLTTSSTFRANILGNLAQVLTLFLFGDNYYGLRLPYALAAVAVILITLHVIKKCVERYEMGKTGRYLLYGTAIYLVCDFSVLMMGRCVENSTLRALITAIFLWIWFANERRPIVRYFALGFLGTISIFLVYFSNIHLLLLAFILGGWELYKFIFKKDSGFPKYFAAWFCGFTLGILISELYYQIVWHSGCFENLFMSLGAFSERVVSTSDAGNEEIIINWIKGFITFWDSNFFFFGIAIGIIVFISLAYLTVRALVREDTNLIAIVGIVLVFIVQCVLTNDWAERKSISILPAIVIIIILGLFFLTSDKERRAISPGLLRTFVILTTLFSLGLVYSTFRFRWNKGYFIDFEATDISIWKIMTLIQLLAGLIFLITIFRGTFCSETKDVKTSRCCSFIRRSSILIAIAAAISINIFFSFKYVYFYDSYTERDARIEIGTIANDQYVAGPFSYGYSLYNDIKPVWNSDYYLSGDMDNNEIQYFCDYEDGIYVKSMNSEEKYHLVQSFPRLQKQWE